MQARTLGMSESRIFWTVVVPSAGPGIVSGTILTFARALGEYGATSMLAGNIPGKTGTISQKIAMVIQDGDYADGGNLGCGGYFDCICDYRLNEPAVRQEDEECKEMVKENGIIG